FRSGHLPVVVMVLAHRGLNGSARRPPLGIVIRGGRTSALTAPTLRGSGTGGFVCNTVGPSVGGSAVLAFQPPPEISFAQKLAPTKEEEADQAEGDVEDE